MAICAGTNDFCRILSALFSIVPSWNREEGCGASSYDKLLSSRRSWTSWRAFQNSRFHCLHLVAAVQCDLLQVAVRQILHIFGWRICYNFSSNWHQTFWLVMMIFVWVDWHKFQCCSEVAVCTPVELSKASHTGTQWGKNGPIFPKYCDTFAWHVSFSCIIV